MYDVKEKSEVVKKFIEEAEGVLKAKAMFGSIKEAMTSNDAPRVKYLITKAVEGVKGINTDILDSSLYVNQTATDGSIKVVDVTIRNKYSDQFKFEFKTQLIASEDVDKVFADFVKCSFTELVVDSLVRKNLEEVNAKFEEIGKAAGNTFKVKVISPLVGEGKKIYSITDKEIVFVADESRAFTLKGILAFCEADGALITEDMIKTGCEEAVARFAQAQTTPQFVGIHEPIIGHICDINKQVKPFTLIKKVYSKNVKKLRGNKETMAYYLEDGVFAVVSVTEAGKEVELQPFNTETLEIADVDVLGNC